MTPQTRRCLTALLQKYQTIAHIRNTSSGLPKQEVQAQMRALAKTFPGALRELDRLPMDDIEARLAMIQQCLDQNQDPPAYLLWMISYHGWLRVFLRIKPMLKQYPNPHTVFLRTYIAAPDEPTHDLIKPELIHTLSQLPSGRLSQLALACVAATYQTDIETVCQSVPLPTSNQAKAPKHN